MAHILLMKENLTNEKEFFLSSVALVTVSQNYGFTRLIGRCFVIGLPGKTDCRTQILIRHCPQEVKRKNQTLPGVWYKSSLKEYTQNYNYVFLR